MLRYFVLPFLLASIIQSGYKKETKIIAAFNICSKSSTWISLYQVFSSENFNLKLF